MEGFTKHEVKEARKAREAQAMLGHPTDRNFLDSGNGMWRHDLQLSPLTKSLALTLQE
jgi:hypothetical protein